MKFFQSKYGWYSLTCGWPIGITAGIIGGGPVKKRLMNLLFEENPNTELCLHISYIINLWVCYLRLPDWLTHTPI